MIALALLFVFIIGLLLVILWLIQKYFDTYSSLHLSENTHLNEFQNHLELKENKRKVFEMEQQINTLIKKRLTEMEEKFPMEQPQEELSEMLIGNFKKVLHSTLNLLKTERYEP